MSRLFIALLLILGLAFGGLAWALAEPGRPDRLLLGILPVAGGLVIVFTLAAFRERERMPAAGGSARLLVYALVVACLAHIAWCSPFEPARAALVLHFGIAAGAAWLLFRSKRGKGVPALPLVAELVIATLLIAVVGAEATLRIYGKLEPQTLFLQRDMSPAARIACVNARPGTVIDGQTVNQDGFTDRPFEHKEGQRTTLVLGDAAFALGVPAPFSAVRVAEASSQGTTFWNATLPHTGLDECAELQSTLGAGLRPEAIVVVLHLGDDLLQLDRTPPQWTGAAMWLDRENVLLNVVTRRVLERVERQRVLTPPEAPITEALADAAAFRARLPWLDDPSLEPARDSDEHLAELSAHAVQVNRHAAANGLVMHAVDLLTAMHERAVAANAKFGVVVMPARYQVDAELWELVRRTARDKDRDAPRTELMQGLRAHGIPTLDLTPALATAQPHSDGRPHLFHRGDVALNARGSRLAGEALGGFVRELLGPSSGSGR